MSFTEKNPAATHSDRAIPLLTALAFGGSQGCETRPKTQLWLAHPGQSPSPRIAPRLIMTQLGPKFSHASRD